MTWLKVGSEPRRRMRRALLHVRAQEISDETAEVLMHKHRTQVHARSRAGQSRLQQRSPTRSVATSFLALIVIGTCLLQIPAMQADGIRPRLTVSLFSATSAACVTGLNVVDPATYWSGLGLVTNLALFQVGGFGIQALGTLWILLLNRRVGARSQRATMTETGALTPGDVRRVLIALAGVTLIVETVVAIALGLRFWTHYDYGLGKAVWYGTFHSVSAFNNAGFTLYSTSLMDLSSDPLIILPIGAAVVIGGLGFLVVVEVVSRATGGRGLIPRRRSRRLVDEQDHRLLAQELAIAGTYSMADTRRHRGLRSPIPLSLHTRLMLWGTLALLSIGSVLFAVLEWRNPATLGAMSFDAKLLNSLFSGGISPRSAGFNSIDYALVGPETRLLTEGLMFVGGGSGSTAGGLKVTTLTVLLAAALAEVRGYRDVETLDRRIPDSTVRVAIAVLLTYGTAVVAATMLMLMLTNLSLDEAQLEVVSALTTAGLDMGVVPDLPYGGQMLLIVLMFLGRIGPLTLASSLTMTSVRRGYRLSEGRPMVG